MNQEAMEAYIQCDAKHVRDVNILSDLIEGSSNQSQIAKKYGVAKQTVTNVKQKHQKYLSKYK